jgi:predicted acylesterase/phospholipase RssA
MIKHLVISGGGPTGFLTYGAASYLAKENVWSLANIKSIYGCSIGAYMGVVFSLGYEWEWLDDYFIIRPWDKLIASSTINIIDMFKEKGFINENFFIESIMPLFRGKDLNEHTTMADLFAFNNIDIHMYACDINTSIIEKIDISHKTHPNLSVIKALQMTMAVPVIFKPIFEGDSCYIDGGILNNYPVNDCLTQQACDSDEILAFKNIWSLANPVINEKSSILDFILIMMRKMQLTLDTETKQAEVKNTINCFVEDMLNGYDKWMYILSDKDTRRKFIEKGYKQAEDFLKNRTLL